MLTSTDATLPSDHPDGKTENYSVPSYRIHKLNFVYAMSKLGQICIVARAIAELVDRPDFVAKIDPVLDKIKEHVYRDDGRETGKENAESASTWTPITMKELDGISRELMDTITTLHDYFSLAEGITICYTPLHAVPWTENATSKNDTLLPKAYILEQVVRRLKNAISIDMAALLHFKG